MRDLDQQIAEGKKQYGSLKNEAPLCKCGHDDEHHMAGGECETCDCEQFRDTRKNEKETCSRCGAVIPAGTGSHRDYDAYCDACSKTKGYETDAEMKKKRY